MQEAKKVVVCGAGVIGSTLAYYLTLRGVKPVIVDSKTPVIPPEGASESDVHRTLLACGGFLPSNWMENSLLEQLAGLSFSLHEELATKFPDTGFRKTAFMRIMTYEHEGKECMMDRALEGDVDIEERVFYTPEEIRSRFPWLDGEDVYGGALVNKPDTAAQVDAGRFGGAMLRAALASGATLRVGCVDSIAAEGEGEERRVTGVVVDGTLVPADAVVVAMGAGSDAVQHSLNFTLPLRRVRGHALQLKAGGGWVEGAGGACCMQAPPPYAEPRLPLEFQALILPQPTGHAWVGTTYQLLPPRASAERSPGEVPGEASMLGDDATFQAMEELVGELCSVLAEAQVVARRTGVRAVLPDGLPVIGEVPGLKGAVLSTGHGSWGTLLAPGSAVAVTELVTEGKSVTVDLTPFLPDRFLPSTGEGEREEAR